MTHLVYLHGFGSGPNSGKAQALANHYDWSSVTIPNLEDDDFYHMTMQSMADVAVSAIDSVADDGDHILLVGSSLGGYLASWLAAEQRLPRHVAGLLLLAPAFDFGHRWRTLIGAEGLAAWLATGERMFYHYQLATERPLSAAFARSCEEVPAFPQPANLPTIIIHGRQDETVPWSVSRLYAEMSPQVEYHLVNSDHALMADTDLALICYCAGRLMQSWSQTSGVSP
ncbi:MAG: alpha/beta fold hydrolase [Sphaerospermopsis sp. SIO1G2]|nr:alpha/beta fold hydrolase [Sphaerospermopsis sp. SIO1G2]